MISEHQFIGSIDTDSPDEVIDPRMVRDARNIVWRGNPGRMRAESVLGTTGINNPFFPLTGANKTIGTFYDDVNQLLFVFNFNSVTDSHGVIDPSGAGTGAIYVYATLTGVWQTLIADGINTVGQPLGFNATVRIQGVQIIYGDNNDGNLLFFINSLGVPTKINIQRYLTTPPTNIVRSYIDVIKAPPSVPPRVGYENDTTVEANNLTNSLFQFCYSYIYNDNEESVISSGSIVPLPTVPFSNTKNTDKTICARIPVYLRTGDQTVTKIRLYMRQTQNGVTSGWFIVDTFTKADIGIVNNGIYKYEFFNNGNFIPADPNFTVLLFDEVPQKANCQELLNGDTLCYAGITEGYDWFKSTFGTNLSFNSNEDVDYIINGVLFFADFNGTFTGSQPNVEIFLTGVGTNDGFGNPKLLSFWPEDMYVLAKSNNTFIGFNTAVFTGDIPTSLAAIAASAVLKGWTLVATNPNSIVITYPTGNIQLQATRIENRFLDVNNISYQLALYPESGYSYGLAYYDPYGRTNGVITDVTANINTLPYTTASNTTITNVQLNLSGILPPAWATYYNVVRTNTLTYNKHLYWVSNQAFSNIGQLIDTQYAYVGITNIADYNLAIQATQGTVSYTFAQGDRIRFIGRYKFDGTFTSLGFDYSVLGVATNPIINGTQQLGNFVQIAYPTADISANFAFDGTVDFSDYFILLYSISSNATPNTGNAGSAAALGNVFYEFGQQYFIGNPGTNLAYHFGNIGDNQVIFNDGDIFARQRIVPAGNTYYLFTTAYAFSNRYTTVPLAATPNPIILTPYFQINQQPPGHIADPTSPAAYPTFADAGGLFKNVSLKTINIRLRGSFQLNADGQTWMDILVKIVNSPVSVTTATIMAHSDGIPANGNQTFDFDGTIAIPPNAVAWLIFGNGATVNNLHINGFLLRMDVINSITIDIFEPSFSDVFNLLTNNNSRALVQDTTAKTTYFSTLFRYSLAYQVGTTINNTNRFYPNNFDEFDKSHGSVKRMRARQRELRIFQERRCGHVGVYAKFIKDNAGVNTLVTTDSIITQNNIEYFEGEYGIGNQPDSLASSGFQDYFADPIKGYFCRLSQDGIIPISELYKIQTFAGINLPKYLVDHIYPWGGISVILGCYHFSKDRASEVIFALERGSLVGPTDPIGGESVAFREDGNAWTSFYDFDPDALVNCENTLFSFWNGVLYSHTNNTDYCQFYGGQHNPSVTLIKNESPGIDKTWIGISLVSNVPWVSPNVYTDSYSYPGQVQQSNLVAGDFNLVEGHWRASFLNDLNSIGGIANGQRLKGTLISAQLYVGDGSKFSFLSNVGFKSNPSPLVQR